jgi:hypothetical protein
MVANPGWQRAESGVQTTPSDRPGRETLCQECGEPVDRDWRFCPNCQEPLRERGLRRHSAEVDVRRDNAGTSGSMILLAVLGGMGVLLTLWLGLAVRNQAFVSDLSAPVLGSLVAGLFVVGLIASVTVLAGNRNRGPGATVGLIAFRSLAFAGVAFLVLGALGLFLFIGCMAAFSGR